MSGDNLKRDDEKRVITFGEREIESLRGVKKAWASERSNLIQFWVGESEYYLFSPHQVSIGHCKGERLRLYTPIGIIEVEGPQAPEFGLALAAFGGVSSIKADGKGIVSVCVKVEGAEPPSQGGEDEAESD